MIVVSFFTDEKYEKYASDLRASLARLGIRGDIQKIRDLGSWKKNTHQKASFIRRKIDEHSREDAVVWIDADAIVCEELSFFESPSFHVACYRWRDLDDGRSPGWNNWGRLMSGTVYFRNSDFSRMVLDAWVDENERFPDRMDQKNLASVLAKIDRNDWPKLARLPIEYCWIERHMRKFHLGKSPVVLHAASFLKGAPERLSVEDLPEMLLTSYNGLGDSFYMRPAIRRFAGSGRRFYLRNPWPQVFRDIESARMVRPETTLRSQSKNVAREFTWHDLPEKRSERFLSYKPEDFEKKKTPIRAFMERLGVKGAAERKDYEFLVPEEWRNRVKAKLGAKLPGWFGILHLPTLRKEWLNPARLPERGYVSSLADSTNINWVLLSPSNKREEWKTDPDPKRVAMEIGDEDLTVEELIGLISLAGVVLTNVCFLFPMASAVGTPVFTVFGGSVGPNLLIEPCMGDQVGWVAPQPFCNCFKMSHDCNKKIPEDRLYGSWFEFLEGPRR